ncbi:MAG: hypothetical protein KAS32_00065 [Candidatus Peribacteraceae bacterium]|nr:hypothetical protein [Candidatus Peribacteraceae bacterium]
MEFDLINVLVEAGTIGVLLYIIHSHSKERDKALEEKSKFDNKFFEYMETKNDTTRKVAHDFSKAMDVHNKKADDRHIQMTNLMSEILGQTKK